MRYGLASEGSTINAVNLARQYHILKVYEQISEAEKEEKEEEIKEKWPEVFNLFMQSFPNLS